MYISVYLEIRYRAIRNSARPERFVTKSRIDCRVHRTRRSRCGFCSSRNRAVRRKDNLRCSEKNIGPELLGGNMTEQWVRGSYLLHEEHTNLLYLIGKFIVLSL